MAKSPWGRDRLTQVEYTHIGFQSLSGGQPRAESLGCGRRNLEEQGAFALNQQLPLLSYYFPHQGLQQHENCTVSLPSDLKSAIKLKISWHN